MPQARILCGHQQYSTPHQQRIGMFQSIGPHKVLPLLSFHSSLLPPLSRLPLRSFIVHQLTIYSGVPTTSDTVSFPANINISCLCNTPTSIASLRLDSPINVTFVSSLAVGVLRYFICFLQFSLYVINLFDYWATCLFGSNVLVSRIINIRSSLTVNGAFSAGGVELYGMLALYLLFFCANFSSLSTGMLDTFNSFNVNGTFSWFSGQIYVLGDAASILTFNSCSFMRARRPSLLVPLLFSLSFSFSLPSLSFSWIH